MSRTLSLFPNRRRPRLLILEDDTALVFRLDSLLTEKGVLYIHVANADEIEPILSSQPMDVVVASTSLLHEVTEPFVALVKRHRPFCQVILLAARFRIDQLVEHLEGGALDFFVKPLAQPEVLVAAIMDARTRAERWRAEFLPKITESAT
jgi:DNA-binding NtrC family response regulator